MRRSILSIILVLIVAVGLNSVVLVAQEDITQANKASVVNALNEFNTGNPQPLFDLFPEQFMMNQGGTELEPMSRADVEGFNYMLLGAIPDLQLIPSVVMAQDDWVVAQTTYIGTFTNTLFFGAELEPTNDAVTWSEMAFFRFEDGLVIESWSMSDPMVMLGQLGMFPAEEEDMSGMMLESPVGYQALSADELTATYASGMEAQNIALVQELFGLGLGVDDSDYYSDSYISWHGDTAVSYIADEQVEEDMAFTGMIASVMPDYVISTPVVIAEGDWVASLVEISGTFTDDTDFFGTPLSATGEPITWQLGVLYRFNAEGKIIELWNETDITPLFVGLGLMSMDEE